MATTGSGSEQRVVLAFFAQPVVVAVLAFCLFPVIDYTGRLLHGAGTTDGGALSIAAGAGFAAVFVVGLAAVPAYVWLGRRGPISLGQTLLAGALLGNLPGVVVVSLQALAAGGPGSTNVSFAVIEAVRAVIIASLVGAAASLVFWWMSGLGRRQPHA